MVLLRPALRSTASPQTVLRRTIDPSTSSVLFGAEHCPPGLWGGVGGVVGMTSSPKPKLRGPWLDDGNDRPATPPKPRALAVAPPPC